MFPHTTAGLGIADVHSHRCWAWHRWLKTTGGGFDNNRLVDDRRVRSTLVLDDLTDASPHSLDGGSRAGRDDSRSAVSGAGVDDVLESRLTTAAMPGGGLAPLLLHCHGTTIHTHSMDLVHLTLGPVLRDI